MPTTTKTDRLKEAHERLTQAVESIVSGDDWQRMLKVASKFHRYSFNNQVDSRLVGLAALASPRLAKSGAD